MDSFNKYYNKGNDCDTCENQYPCGKYGDAVGCRCQDANKECAFIPVNCAFCDSFTRDEMKCEPLGYSAASNSGELCWEWHRERHEDCPLNSQN